MTDNDYDEDWEDYDSGPFCMHWGELGDCDDLCSNCNHTCNEHVHGHDYCEVDDCNCEKQKE